MSQEKISSVKTVYANFIFGATSVFSRLLQALCIACFKDFAAHQVTANISVEISTHVYSILVALTIIYGYMDDMGIATLIGVPRRVRENVRKFHSTWSVVTLY